MNLITRSKAGVRIAVHSMQSAWNQLKRELDLIVDRQRWSDAPGWHDRLDAVSWPRASILSVMVAVPILSLWLILQPTGIRAHPPRLPTEREWQATKQASEAFEGDLSPALTAANQSVPPGDAS